MGWSAKILVHEAHNILKRFPYKINSFSWTRYSNYEGDSPTCWCDLHLEP